MSSIKESSLGLNYGWSYGETGWNSGMDENIVLTGFHANKQVKGILSTPPTIDVNNGDAYIVGSSPTGTWVGKYAKVAIYDRGSWLFATPSTGVSVYNKVNGCWYEYNNGWSLKPEAEESPYIKVKDFDFSTGYTITDSRQLLFYPTNQTYYQWNGTLPKVVAAGSTPVTSGGVGAWVDRTDATLRSELISGGSSILEISKIKSTEMKHTIRYSDFTSLSSLASYITSNGMDRVEIVFDEPLLLSSNNGSLVILSNMTYLKITSLEVHDSTAYTTPFDICRIFDLTNVKHVDIEVDATSTLLDVNGDKQGLCIVRLNGCDTFSISGSTTGCYQVHELTNVKNIVNKTVNTGTRYPCHLYNGNGVIDVQMKNIGCRRDFFVINGASGGSIVVDSTDQGDASQLKHYTDSTYTNPITSNIDIKFKHRSTGLYDSSRPARWSPILIDTSIDSTATGVVIGSTFKNIKIEYDIVGDKFGSIISFRKLVDDSSGDLTGRNYTLHNINISGHIELNSSSTAYFFNYRDGDNWQALDRVRNVKLSNLRVSGTSSPVFNPNQLKLAIDTSLPLRLENVTALTSTIIDATTDYTDYVVCSDTKLSSHTSTIASSSEKSVLKHSGKVLKPVGVSIIQVATVENYRSICGVRLNIKAYSGKTDATNIAVGAFNGVIKFASSTPGSWLGSYTSSFSQGVSVTPNITLGVNGEVYISLPEWSALEVYIPFEMEIQYNQYSTNAQCSTIKGLVSTRYNIVT